ncbi:MAG: glycosyltransferase family 4 protein [Tatlockia sp.]|nr:glycosyltransferase family 4 protein [Tatlockia sp.]
MKLILSITPIRFPLTGIGRYTWELARHLASQSDIESLVYFAQYNFINHLPKAGEHASTQHWLKRVVQKSYVLSNAYNMLIPQLQRRALKPKNDHLFHGPNFYLPPFAGKKIATFHDLSLFTRSDDHPPERVRYAQKAALKTIKTADALIVDAEFIRQELASYFGYPLDKIYTVPLAAGEEFRPYTSDETKAVLSQYGLQHGLYSFYAGTIEPRKNLLTLLNAYEKLPLGLRQQFPLVLSGYKGWLSEAIHERIDKAKQSGWVKYLGFTPSDHFPALFAGARLFAFPSLYEGFGLPILEAMASGVPVICSNASTLPEVAGDAALMASPHDVDAWTELLHQGLMDDEWRAQAISLGYLQGAQFSWSRCATQTLAAYKAVIAS